MVLKNNIILGLGVLVLLGLHYLDHCKWSYVDKPIKDIFLYENHQEQISYNGSSNIAPITSDNLEIEWKLLEKNYKIDISEKEYQILLDIVEAEARGEDLEGKLLVVNVILNRVGDDNFPNNIEDVVFQKNDNVTQFSPITGSRFQNLEISDETIEAVRMGLEGEDISQGALYFVARKVADESALSWFDKKLTYLFTHGGHEFFY